MSVPFPSLESRDANLDRLVVAAAEPEPAVKWLPLIFCEEPWEGELHVRLGLVKMAVRTERPGIIALF